MSRPRWNRTETDRTYSWQATVFSAAGLFPSSCKPCSCRARGLSLSLSLSLCQESDQDGAHQTIRGRQEHVWISHGIDESLHGFHIEFIVLGFGFQHSMHCIVAYVHALPNIFDDIVVYQESSSMSAKKYFIPPPVALAFGLCSKYLNVGVLGIILPSNQRTVARVSLLSGIFSRCIVECQQLAAQIRQLWPIGARLHSRRHGPARHLGIVYFALFKCQS